MMALNCSYKMYLYMHMLVDDLNFFSFVIYLSFCLFKIGFCSSSRCSVISLLHMQNIMRCLL